MKIRPGISVTIPAKEDPRPNVTNKAGSAQHTRVLLEANNENIGIKVSLKE